MACSEEHYQIVELKVLVLFFLFLFFFQQQCRADQGSNYYLSSLFFWLQITERKQQMLPWFVFCVDEFPHARNAGARTWEAPDYKQPFLKKTSAATMFTLSSRCVFARPHCRGGVLSNVWEETRHDGSGESLNDRKLNLSILNCSLLVRRSTKVKRALPSVTLLPDSSSSRADFVFFLLGDAGFAFSCSFFFKLFLKNRFPSQFTSNLPVRLSGMYFVKQKRKGWNASVRCIETLTDVCW